VLCSHFTWPTRLAGVAAVVAAVGAAVGPAAAGVVEASAAEVGHVPQRVEPGPHREVEQAPERETSIARRVSVEATDRLPIDLPQDRGAELVAVVGRAAASIIVVDNAPVAI
jgi:hypothetical protein